MAFHKDTFYQRALELIPGAVQSWNIRAGRLPRRYFIFDTPYSVAVYAHLDCSIDQVPSAHVVNCSLEQSPLESWNGIGNDDDQVAVEFHHSEEPKEIDAVVGDEREFVVDDPFGQFPVRFAGQTEMVDMGCFETSSMSDSNQRFMQAFVDQELHALLSKVLRG